MTREEAIAKVTYRNNGDGHFSDSVVDSLVALGILKLDEPKSPAERRCEAIAASFGIFMSEIELRRMEQNFDAAGLKIVEK